MKESRKEQLQKMAEMSPEEMQEFLQKANDIPTKGIRRRRFLGKKSGFENKTERSFEKAHLKAYLKGKKRFNFGFEGRDLLGNLIPKSYPVKQEFYYE